MKVHRLKIKQHYFDLLMAGKKTCEIRKNDRQYKIGDIIVYNQDDYQTEFLITHIDTFRYGIKEGYVVLSISFYIASINRNAKTH